MAECTVTRYGILGCAQQARTISKAIMLAPNSSLVAIGSRSIDKAKQFAQSNEFPLSTKIYGSYDEVLDDADVDAVYIPLPTGLHLYWAVKAAEKKKHVLLEKPTAFNVDELDKILDACESNRVQFMDGTVWWHHPRTISMLKFLHDPKSFGQLKEIQTNVCWHDLEHSLEDNIRSKPDLDGLGALGDAGWYCIGASLFANDYELPKYVTAQNNAVKNEAGVILSCEASLFWDDGRVGNFRCSFISGFSMTLKAIGTNGTLCVTDFVVPFKADAALYKTKSEVNSAETETKEEFVDHIVTADIRQEVFMIKEFSSLLDRIKRLGVPTEKKWPIISRKIQVVTDAVLASIQRAGEKVEVY